MNDTSIVAGGSVKSNGALANIASIADYSSFEKHINDQSTTKFRTSSRSPLGFITTSSYRHHSYNTRSSVAVDKESRSLLKEIKSDLLRIQSSGIGRSQTPRVKKRNASLMQNEINMIEPSRRWKAPTTMTMESSTSLSVSKAAKLREGRILYSTGEPWTYNEVGRE